LILFKKEPNWSRPLKSKEIVRSNYQKMDYEREKKVIKESLRNACYKAGKLFTVGEFVTREKFTEIIKENTKLTLLFCSCPSLMYVEYSRAHARYTVLVKISSQFEHYFRCSFNIVVPGEKFSVSQPIITGVALEEWKMEKLIDYIDIFSEI
jgi:hypothetical protein